MALYFFWTLLFGIKYSCLPVPQIGMAHLRFYSFSMSKDKRYMSPTGTFYSYWASRKSQKPKGGMGGDEGGLKRTYF